MVVIDFSKFLELSELSRITTLLLIDLMCGTYEKIRISDTVSHHFGPLIGSEEIKIFVREQGAHM